MQSVKSKHDREWGRLTCLTATAFLLQSSARSFNAKMPLMEIWIQDGRPTGDLGRGLPSSSRRKWKLGESGLLTRTRLVTHIIYKIIAPEWTVPCGFYFSSRTFGEDLSLLRKKRDHEQIKRWSGDSVWSKASNSHSWSKNHKSKAKNKHWIQRNHGLDWRIITASGFRTRE